MLFNNSKEPQWHNFSNPYKSVSTFKVSEVSDCLKIVEEETSKNKWAVGYLTYEAGKAFDDAFMAKESDEIPLLNFSFFHEAELVPTPTPPEMALELNWEQSISKKEYIQNIQKIKSKIKSGDTYQVNYTYFLLSHLYRDPYELFAAMHTKQQCQYSAYLETEDYAICSASPELLFEYDGQTIITKPMKGTRPRTEAVGSDEMIKELRTSTKDLAENTMIVDMARNDLSRIAKLKDVDLYDVETYPTVYQMTSTIKAETKATLSEIFQAIFPAASITGAPKYSTSKIISDLESDPRGIYTGSIGVISPQNKMQFNVAIRTALVNKNTRSLKYGIGGGIVWDSEASAEWKETIDKAKIVESSKDFYLFETVSWNKENGFCLIDYHLKRLKTSASNFGIKFSDNELRQELNKSEQQLSSNERDTRCVRIILHKKGTFEVQLKPLVDKNFEKKIVKFDTQATDTKNIYIQNKTSFRAIYERAQKTQPNFFDIILWNQNNEITESTIANIVIKNGASYSTPPESCGLLPGTFRQKLIENKIIDEQIIYKNDLQKADEIFLINSVRGWVRVHIE